MKMYKISPDNYAVYQAIVKFWTINQYSPSVQELVKQTGKAKTTVLAHLDRLERAGWIRTEQGKARTLRPVGMEITIPILNLTS